MWVSVMAVLVVLSSSSHTEVFAHLEILNNKAIIARSVGTPLAKRKGYLRGIQTGLNSEEAIDRILFMGRGLYILIFASEFGAHSVVACFPISIQKQFLFSPWYADFKVATFEERNNIPRFLVKLLFL